MRCRYSICCRWPCSIRTYPAIGSPPPVVQHDYDTETLTGTSLCSIGLGKAMSYNRTCWIRQATTGTTYWILRWQKRMKGHKKPRTYKKYWLLSTQKYAEAQPVRSFLSAVVILYCCIWVRHMAFNKTSPLSSTPCIGAEFLARYKPCGYKLRYGDIS